MALLLGFALVSALGVAHHYGLMAIRVLTPKSDNSSQVAIILVFVGLLALHTLEIVSFAVIYKILLNSGAFGALDGAYDENWESLFYFSGINFSTLGYTEINTNGSIRMVSMMQSLGGFMVLTWSATFLYSVCERSWRN